MNRNCKHWLSSVGCLLVLVSTQVWATPPVKNATFPPLPEGFSSFGAAVSDGYAYVYGGHVGRTHHYSTETVHGKFRRLNLDQPQLGWEELPEGPRLQGLALVSHDGKLYRIGGMQPQNKEGEPRDNVSLKSVAVFDPQAKKWSELPDLPNGRSSHDAIVVGNRIVVVGGWTMHGKDEKSVWRTNTLILDLSQKDLRWESIEQPFQKRALNLTVQGNQAVVVGGMDSAGQMSRDLYFLDPVAKTWHKGPRLPGLARNAFSPAACSIKGTVYISPLDGLVYRLKKDKSGWQEVGDLAEKRMVHRLLPGPSALLVLGGGSREGNIASVEVISLKADESN